MRQKKPPSTPRHKQAFRLFWHGVYCGSTQLVGPGDDTRWAFSEAQARRLLHMAFERRFGRNVFVSWSEEGPIGDYPEPPVVARPLQTELFPVCRALSRAS